MRILTLTPLETFFFNVSAWLILHFGIGYLCSIIPTSKFNSNKPFYQASPWEKGGDIYQRLFHVRTWKHIIPQGSKVYQNTFSLQHLTTVDPAYLELWLRESIRAEFCHWVMIFPGLLFFLWNDFVGGMAMIIYAVIVNLIPIILQRYNRPRVRRLLKQTGIRKTFVKNPFISQEYIVSI